jgi:formylglycine-generating enzyme required for sulfatase activity
VQYACATHESPVRQVSISGPLYVGRYEVTQAQWQAIMGANPSLFSGLGDSPSRPVERVSFAAVQDFVQQADCRLPTEAEWEFACRAGTATAFHAGSDSDLVIESIAWCSANAGNQTHAVGQKLPNALGIHDMMGNVAEWVSDWYASSYPAGPAADPTGPDTGTKKVIRGGGWGNTTNVMRSSGRASASTSVLGSASTIGFRIVKEP